MRKQGDRLRISAQLIDTSSSVYVWSETYERDLSDAFAVQDEISRSIVTHCARNSRKSTANRSSRKYRCIKIPFRLG